MSYLQAISAKHFQQMQDEAVARGQQAAEAEERTGDHLLPACSVEGVGGEAEERRRENHLLPALTEEEGGVGGEAFTEEEGVERTEEGRLPIRPLVEGEAHPPLETEITFSSVDKVQTCVMSNELP